MPTEAHESGPAGSRYEDPSAAAGKYVAPPKMGDFEADLSAPLPDGHNLIWKSINQAAKEGVEISMEETEDKISDAEFDIKGHKILTRERESSKPAFGLQQALLHSALTRLRIGEFEKALHQLR